jgi:hypothetical protein
MNPELNDDTIVDAEIVEESAPGKELARIHRTVEVIPEGAWTDTVLTVILPPAMTPAESAAAFVPLAERTKWSASRWHRWMYDVSDAVGDGDKATVETLLALGATKGWA